VPGVFYAFWIAVDSNGDQPWNGGTGILATSSANPGTVTLDVSGNWSSGSGNLSSSSGFLAMGSHTASAEEYLLINAVFTPPSTWAGSGGAVGYPPLVTFDIY
jgi:hypothetical protein